jgi:tetraacyldisaccharide-1-P 4'-kinase
VHDFILKRENVKLIMCDDFYQGAFLPIDNKIMLCANTLMLKKDFDNALRR